MPLDTSIPLKTFRAPPLDITGELARGEELRYLRQGRRLQALQIEDVERERETQAALRDIYSRHTDTGTVGSREYLRDLARVSPEAARAEQSFQLQQQQAVMELDAATLDFQSDLLSQAIEISDEMLRRLTTCIDAGSTEAGQACYQREKAAFRQFLSARGLPTAEVDALPETMDVQQLNQLRQRGLTEKERLDEAYRQTELDRFAAKERIRTNEAIRRAEAVQPLKRELAAETGGATAARITAESQERLAREQRQATQKQIDARTVQTAVHDIFRSMEGAALLTTGFGGWLLSGAPGTAAFNINSLLDNIRSNVSFARLQIIRDNATGGGLGPVSDFENRLMASTLGNLEQAQTKAQFVRQLAQVHNTFLDVVYGVGKGPSRLPQAGELSKAAQAARNQMEREQIYSYFLQQRGLSREEVDQMLRERAQRQ